MAGERAVARRGDGPRVDWTPVAGAVVALLAAAVYRATMLPGLGAWDTAEAQTIPWVLGTFHPTGFPAYVVLGFLWTHALAWLVAPATAMNLLAVVLVALGAGLAVAILRRLGAPALLAALVALGFALTPVVWGIATAADAHTLHLALLALLTVGLLRWESLVRAWRATEDDQELRRRADRTIVATAAVFGVMLANHALTLLLVPGIGLFVLATDARVLLRPRLVVTAVAAALAVAALLYLELPLRAGPFRAPLVYGEPDTWSGFWDIVLAKQFQGDVAGPLANWDQKLASLLELASLQFGPLLALIPAGLLVTALRFPRYALFSGLAVLVTCFFAASYANARIDRYYLGPVLFSWTWIGAFAAAIANRVLGTDAPDEDDPAEAPRPAAPVRGPGPAAILVPALLGLALLVPTATAFRDRWAAADLSSQDWVKDWLTEAFDAFEPNAVVISWWSYSTPMWYGQLIEGRRPDVWVVDDRTRLDEDLGEIRDVIEANLDTRPVYLVRLQDSEVQAFRDTYTIEPVGRPGNVFRVTGRQETSP